LSAGYKGKEQIGVKGVHKESRVKKEKKKGKMSIKRLKGKET